MADLIEGVIVQARECSNACTCGDHEREVYYQAIMKQLKGKRHKIITESVSEGMPRHKARLLAKEQIEAEAKEKAEEIVRAKTAGSCYLFFDPTEKGRISLGYEDIDMPVLNGESVLRAVMSLGEFTLQELREVIDKGTFTVSLPDAPDVLRSFTLFNTTPLRKFFSTHLDRW